MPEVPHQDQSKTPASLSAVVDHPLNAEVWRLEIARLQSAEKRSIETQQQLTEELHAKRNELEKNVNSTEALKEQLKSHKEMNGNLEKAVKSLELESQSRLRRIQGLEKEKTVLQKENGEVSEAKRRIRNEWEFYRKETERLGAEKRNIEQIHENKRIHLEQEHKKRADAQLAEIKQLKDCHQNYVEAVRHLESIVQKLEDEKAEANFKIESLNESLQKSQKDKLYHEDDARRLRFGIAEASNQQNPRRDEEYYICGFGALEADIQNWIAKNAKAHAAQALSSQPENHLLQSLLELGEHGQRVSEYLLSHNRLRVWYSTPSYRIQLARHIVATFLFASVFYPFVVGLPNTSSEMLSWIDNDMESRGSSPLRPICCAEIQRDILASFYQFDSRWEQQLCDTFKIFAESS
jgi:hypothetical protein